MIDGATVLARHPEARRDASGLLIGDMSLHLNPTALEVWDTFDGRLDLDEVVATVAHRYDQTIAEVATEISRIAAALHAEGALLRVGGPTRPTPTRSVPADELDWALVRWARGGPAPRVPEVTGDEWTALLTRLRSERLDGLLVALVGSTDQHLDEQRHQDLRARHAQLANASQQLEQRLVAVHDLFVDRGIEHRVLKGLAHARLDYPRWDMRPSGDVDVLVARHDLVAAAGLLCRAEGRRQHPELRPGHDARFAKAVTITFDRPRVEVDVHASLVSGPFGVWMKPGMLFEQSRALAIGNRALRALSVADAFVHSCFTAQVAAWDVRPMALLDILQLADQGPDPDRVWSLCRSWRATSVVTGACALVLRHLPEEQPTLAAWLTSPNPVTRTEHLVAGAEGVPRSYVMRELLTVAVQPTVAGRVGYMRAVVAPRRRSSIDWRSRMERAWRDLRRTPIRIR